MTLVNTSRTQWNILLTFASLWEVRTSAFEASTKVRIESYRHKKNMYKIKEIRRVKHSPYQKSYWNANMNP